MKNESGLHKKILFVSQYFYPEVFRGNDIAFDLVQKGHNVTVITGTPNYPHGKFFEGYGIFKRSREKVKGVNVIRLPIIPRGNGSKYQLLFNYLSFAIVGSFYGFYISFRKKFDLIFVQQLSPVTMSLPAIVVKKLQKIPMYLWVLDLWPESLISAGGYDNKFILGFFDVFVKLQYNNAEKILVSSKGFVNFIEKKGKNKSKIMYFPNWAEAVFNDTPVHKIPKLPDGFLVMFAGNIGECQDFDNVMKAAKELSNIKDIHFIILGEGRKKDNAIKFVKENKLNKTVHFLGRYPISDMPSFFSAASVMLVSLKDDLVFNATAPAKLQAYMAAGKPVIGMLNGDGANIIKDAQCGISVPAGNYNLLAQAILNMRKMSQNKLSELGNNGKNFCRLHFDKEKCLNHLCDIMGLRF